MKLKTQLEKKGATFATFLVIPLVLPIYMIERLAHTERNTPIADILMQSAQNLGATTIRSFTGLFCVP